MYVAILQKIPLALVAILLIVTVVMLCLRSKNVTRSEFVKILKNAKYFQAWMLIAVIVLTGFFGIFYHLKSKQSVRAVVALNYPEASQAQNSNATRYNMNEIICDEVVAAAIEMGAFEDVTVKQLKDCLSVYPYIQGDVQDESQYHISTEFVVEYHASKDTQHLDTENVIKLISNAYKEYYIEKYTENFIMDSEIDKPNYSEMEYMDIVLYFDKEISTILNYLYGMSGKGISFISSNNTTFDSIAGKVYQFKETQIDQNLRSLILQHGVVKDRDGYIDRLSYQNKNVDFDRRRNAVSYDLCNQAVAMYAEEMTRIVLVPTWDTSGKYYMGRTKVGIDELSVMATVYSDRVASNEKEIMDNNLIINRMRGAAGNSPTHETTDALIAEIDKSIKGFAQEAVAIGREYSSYRMNRCIAVSIYGISLFSELKTIILFAILAYASVVLYAVARAFPKR